MKKAMALLIALSIVMPCAAFAQTAEAIVIAANTVKITAPYSGTLLPFDIAQGDTVSAGDVLFRMDETPVYAPEDGTVSAVFATPGDDAAGLTGRYGGLVAIESAHPKYIAANIREAYNDAENKWVHAGEILYLKKGNDKGTGRVTQVNGDDYTVEILTGNFDVDDNVQCYRESGYANDSATGRGRVKRYPDTRIQASGRIASVLVSAGDSVSTGDVLFTVRDTSAPKDARSEIEASAGGPVSALYVRSGSMVVRGMLLCEIADLSSLVLSCDLDELDIAGIHAGDTLSFTLDAYGDRTFTGTVMELRPLGEKRTNASYYDLRISLPKDGNFLPGMNATVLLGE